MPRRVDPGHDPERFYHCDCIRGGYNPHAERVEELEFEVARLTAKVAELETTAQAVKDAANGVSRTTREHINAGCLGCIDCE